MLVIYVIVAIVTGFSLFDYYVNKNWEAVTSSNRNEAVFAHRNREYGAYVLRTGYNKRMSLIMGGLVLVAGLAFLASVIIKNLPKEQIKKPKISGTNLTVTTPPEDVPPPVAPPPPPPPMVQTAAFIAPVAEDDYVEEELPSQNQLTNQNIGTENIDGEAGWGDASTSEETGPSMTQNTQEEEVVDVAEEDALFPGGEDKLGEYITNAISKDYPEEALDLGVKGKVVVRFVVEKNGQISNATIERPIAECPSCNKLALKVVSNMPNWTPAKNAGRPVRIFVRIPIGYSSE
ncbi:MAG: hypothetical protein RLZZ301_1282 [Bacteroidota bacterium]|jgi:protein TonB